MSDTGTFRIKALGELQGFEEGETFNGVFLEGSIPAIRSVGAHLLEDVAIVPASALPILVEALEQVLNYITLDDMLSDDTKHNNSVFGIRLGDLRRARAALASIKGGSNV